jgi:flagellar basal-body rod modification protein FlgD
MVNGLTANNAPLAADNAVTGSGGSGGLLSMEKDTKEAQTEPKFGQIWQQIQSKYGAKPEKPREIKKTLGKDDFMRIMITQMRHQDPTKPFDAEQMASQMAQFASVEQLSNINSAVAKMGAANQPLEKMAMTNLIGKTVTVDRGKFAHTEGQSESLSFALPQDAATVKIAISNEQGEKVLEKDLGPMKKGETAFSWDGNKVNTLPAKAGTYSFDIEAVDQRGTVMQLNPQRKAMVVGVSFEGSEPVLLVGDAKQQDKVTMRNVVRIDNAAGVQMPMPGQNMAPAQALPQAAMPSETPEEPKPSAKNLISFEKGVGSANFDASKMTPEVQQALAKYQSQAAEAAAAQNQASAAGTVKAEGFPNGLSEESSAQPNQNITVEKGGSNE